MRLFFIIYEKPNFEIFSQNLKTHRQFEGYITDKHSTKHRSLLRNLDIVYSDDSRPYFSIFNTMVLQNFCFFIGIVKFSKRIPKVKVSQ